MKRLKRLTRAQAILAQKEYGVENPRERFGIYRFSKDSVTFWDNLENKAMDPIRI
ncbi:hypothetical protein [Clostridium perfringens]|uniref:hypothetical protein n=1 Tax=Clostridium perfringens TaxID=1502 RepID=UPI0024BCB0D4|nr:hypothetical protein [Clostridium perfringens]